MSKEAGTTIRRATYAVALVLVPGAMGVFGQDLIFDVFGSDGFVPAGSVGSEVLDWWEGPFGGHLLCGALAGAIALLGLRRFGRALLVAALATGLFWIYGIAAFFIYFLLGGDPAWN